MKKKKLLFDAAFIILAALFLTLMLEINLDEKYIGFALIPLLVAYYLGQWVERKVKREA